MDLDLADREKFARLSAMEPDVLKCMGCGSCTATCTAGKFTPTSVRSAILALMNGKAEDACNLLKGCLLCGKCTLVCPRSINTRHLIMEINKTIRNERKNTGRL